jgi:uncharacterized protein YceH (UPF0502 family)
VLGTLMEKARTVPDSYPLTLNTLTLAATRKPAAIPLMNLGENRRCRTRWTRSSC